VTSRPGTGKPQTFFYSVQGRKGKQQRPRIRLQLQGWKKSSKWSRMKLQDQEGKQERHRMQLQCWKSEAAKA